MAWRRRQAIIWTNVGQFIDACVTRPQWVNKGCCSIYMCHILREDRPTKCGAPFLKQDKGAVTYAVCPESAWLVTFLIGNVSTGVVTWSALPCGASGESGKKVAAAPLSKTAAAAAAAKTWFAKHPLDYMLHNRFPWKRSGRRSSMWPPYSLRRNLSAAACRPCDRSLSIHVYDVYQLSVLALKRVGETCPR